MRVKEVLDQIKNGKLTKLEKIEFIEETTKGYKEEKVELLRREIKSAIFRIKRKHKIDPAVELVNLLSVIKEEYADMPFDQLLEMANNCLAVVDNQKQQSNLNLQSVYNSWSYKGDSVSESNKREVCYLIMAFYYLSKKHGMSRANSLIDILELAGFDFLINQELNSRVPDNQSNNDKLSRASGWMDVIMKRITALDIAKHEDVYDIFDEEYPGFKLKFDLKKLKTPLFAKGGRLLKTSIGEAIKFIYEHKYPNDSVEADTIIRKYNNKNYW